MEIQKLLDIFCEERINTALEERLINSEEYVQAKENADKECQKFEEMKLNKDLGFELDHIISAYNAFGAAYGKDAYKQGLHDGIKLTLEILCIFNDTLEINKMSKDSQQLYKEIIKDIILHN